MLRILSTITVTVLLAAALPTFAQDAMPGPQVGDSFTHALSAPDQYGKTQTVDSLMGDKGLVVFFVRSADWCPFCKRQLGDVNGRLAEFKALGLNVASVSVDEIAETKAFSDEHDVAYPMLADPAGDINKVLGIRDEQYPVGHAAFGVPRPVLYVIDRSKTIRLAYMEPTYRTRPDLDKVLADAAALGL
jgi:peroxiredoxin